MARIDESFFSRASRRLLAACVLAAGVATIVGSGGGTPEPPVAGEPFISLRDGGSDPAQYYTSIGATGDTFAAFRQRNGFDVPLGANAPVRAVYFNAGDLNLGRDMNCLANASGLACYVSNHTGLDVNGKPIFSDDPTAAFAAMNNSQSVPFATVAMEGGAVIGPLTVAVRECDGAMPLQLASAGACRADEPPPPFTGEITDPVPAVDVDSGVDLQPGDVVSIRATGSIYAGVLFTGRNGPAGWNNIDSDPKFPLRNSFPYALIGHIDSGPPFYIGDSRDFTHTGPAGRLFLRTNDDTPGNGRGHFDVSITVRKPVKFYVYDGAGQLQSQAALDGEGAKKVPGVCLACHGGEYVAATNTVSGASFLPFNLKSFKYGSGPGQSRAEQEESFRRLNALVRATRPSGAQPPDAIAEFIDGMYLPRGVGTPGAVARDDYVPAGWATKPNLYLGVVRPYCSGCHMALNTSLKVLDFNHATQLTGKAALVDLFVCGTRTMPHSEVAFRHFWLDDGGTWPDYLATELGRSGCPR